MSAKSWIEPLQKAYRPSRASEKVGGLFGRPRVAILGVGNELDGDDAAGVVVARHLRQALPSQENLLIIEAGLAPENFSAPVRRFQPDLLLFIDAAMLRKEPGSISWVELEEVDGVSAATHGLPITMIAKYLAAETGCRVGLIAIQAGSFEFELPVTEPVEAAIDEIVGGLVQLLTD